MNEKAFLQSEKGDTIPCMFNPAQLVVSRANVWIGDSMPGKGVPNLRYGGADSGRLSFVLYFDTTDDGTAASKHTDKLLKLMEIDPSLPGYSEGDNNGRPPWVQLHWGDLHSFRAVITSLTLRFTYFSATGTPLRAEADVGLVQYEPVNNFGPQNPTSGTPRPHRVHQVQSGETLDRIAAAHYGDATKWRAIAEANALEDPLALRPGALLAIPKLSDT